MEINAFQFARTPQLFFGAGKSRLLPELLSGFGKHVLLVTGASSFQSTQQYEQLLAALRQRGMQVQLVSIAAEPSPGFVDEVVSHYRASGISVVAGVGGGSALDAGKAISAMLLQHGSVAQFLEAKENKPHNGDKVPFIAVPTTAGTGSEATKNAVLSEIGVNGFKSSLRHDRFVPDIAVVDPELALSCPVSVTAACGLDAFSQLLEGYVSTTASAMTDALAVSGITHFAAGYRRVLQNGAEDVQARSHMAYASLLSGMVLANAGLGLVHGYAGVLGGAYNIPHGVVCGTLLAEANRATISCLLEDKKQNAAVLEKFSHVYCMLSGAHPGDPSEDSVALIAELEQLVGLSKVKSLGAYGVDLQAMSKIAAASSCKNNPVKLDAAKREEILRKRL